jgi:hypothetical protein
MLSDVVFPSSFQTKSEGYFSKGKWYKLVDITTIDAHEEGKSVTISHLLDFADLFQQRMKMLQAVKLQAQAIDSMQATDHACLLYRDYLEAFRIQQQAQQGNRRPRCFPEHDISFAFEEGGMIFGVNRPGVDRSGIPLWTGNCQHRSQQSL